MQDYVNLEIKKKSGLSLNPDIHHSKVPSSGRNTVARTLFHARADSHITPDYIKWILSTACKFEFSVIRFASSSYKTSLSREGEVIFSAIGAGWSAVIS